MWIRTVHRWVGLVLSPFLLITAVAGGLLLWRRAMSLDLRHDLIDLHNYEVIGNYVGAVVAGGLVVMVATGVALRVQMWRRQRRSHR
jgi:uncharacterized iron-regulated membrane protein